MWKEFQMINSNKESVIQTVRRVLSANQACDESDFGKESISFHTSEIREGRFRFPYREKSLSIVTMGNGTVVTADAGRIDWLKEHLQSLNRGQVFSAANLARIVEYVHIDKQFMAGPDQKYVCSLQDLRAFSIPHGVTITTFYRDQVHALYGHKEFQHALSFRVDSERPDRVATIAEYEGTVIGIAGASEDCSDMWQIGVDVRPEYQGLGVGKALVGTLSQAVLNEGIIPYYSTEVSNLHSRQLAISLGYWPAWIELYARDLV
jgi:GNAT superfamily N-acetyltransferase